MFDLDKEVKLWIQSFKGRSPEKSIDEIIDHLYCEIENLQNEGFSEQEAFEKAIQQFGSPSLFLTEQAKNRSLSSKFFRATGLSKLYQFEKKFTSPSKTSKFAGIQIILVSILFAIAMVIAPKIITDKNIATTIVYLLIALWWIFFVLLVTKNNRYSLKCEYLWIKRNVSKL